MKEAERYTPDKECYAGAALAAYGGKTVIYIGENEGSCTGDEYFFSQISTAWEEVDRIEIPQWWGVHDDLSVYRRK